MSKLPLSALLAVAGPPSPATEARAALLEATTRYADLVEVGRGTWRKALDAEKARLGRSHGLSSAEMDAISARPEHRARKAAETKAREAAKAALARYDEMAKLDADWLESWLGQNRENFEQALVRAETEAAKRRRIAANKGALDALVAEILAVPETRVDNFRIGDCGVSTAYGIPPLFRVEKVTHGGNRVLVRRLVGEGTDLVKLVPGEPRGHLRAATWHRRVSVKVAQRYAELWGRIYAPESGGR